MNAIWACLEVPQAQFLNWMGFASTSTTEIVSPPPSRFERPLTFGLFNTCELFVMVGIPHATGILIIIGRPLFLN